MHRGDHYRSKQEERYESMTDKWIDDVMHVFFQRID